MRIKGLLGILLIAIAINLGVITSLTQKDLLSSLYKKSLFTVQAINVNQQFYSLKHNLLQDLQNIRLMGLVVENLGYEFLQNVKAPLFALTGVVKDSLGSQQVQAEIVWELVVNELGQVDKLVRNDYNIPELFTRGVVVKTHQNKKLTVVKDQYQNQTPQNNFSFGKVLGETNISVNNLKELIAEGIKKYLEENKLLQNQNQNLTTENLESTTVINNFYGQSGSVNNESGFTSSVVGGVPLVTYMPTTELGYSGTSFAGFSQLSSDVLTSGDVTATGNLSVTGNATLSSTLSVSGSSTLSSLEVSGNTIFSGSTTLSGLNLGFSAGSVVFDSGTGFAQNNANLFWNNTNKYLNIGTNTVASTLAIQVSGAVNPLTIASSSGTTLFNILPSGYVGIGTASPTSPLHIKGIGGLNIQEPSSGANLITLSNTSNTGIWATYLASGDLRFYDLQNSADRLAIQDGTGNVGIGTTSPQKTLHLYSTGDTALVIDGTSSINPYISFRQGNVEAAYFQYTNTGSLMRYNAGGGHYFSGGNMGVGTSTPIAKLAVVGTAGANPILDIASSSLVSVLRIDHAGNVGIGTTTPMFPLDVASYTSSNQTYGWLNSSGATGTSSGVNNYSIRASQRIIASEFNAVSDSRLKDVQFALSPSLALDLISQLNPVSYTWKNNPTGQPILGFLAQEVEGVIPNAVSKIATENFVDQRELNYNQLTTVAIGAIRQLNENVNTLQTTINNLQNSGNDLSANIAIKLQSHLYLSEDSVGQAKILLGAKQVRVKFEKAYEFQPIVTLTPASNVQSNYWVAEADTTGFTIMLETGERQDVVFNWHAFASEKAKLTVSDGSFENIVLVVSEPEEKVESSESSGAEENLEGATREEEIEVVQNAIVEETVQEQVSASEPEAQTDSVVGVINTEASENVLAETIASE